MEYLQSFLIVVMEMVCFFLFQDAFVPTEKKHKSGGVSQSLCKPSNWCKI